jgi:hypothetical protein
MYKTYTGYLGQFTIIDTDFTEQADFTGQARKPSLWMAIIEIYGRRKLNVWANFAKALQQFIHDHPPWGITDMLLFFKEEKYPIDYEALERYMVLYD